MIHNVSYAFKILFRNRTLIFWTFAFPLVLATFFHLAFSNIENSEKLEIMKIAIVDNESFQDNEIMKEAFKALQDEEKEDRLFEVEYVTQEKAKELLEEDKIIGYLHLKDTPKVVIKSNGIYPTIFKSITEELLQSEELIKDTVEKRIQEKIHLAIENGESMEKIDSWYAEVYQEQIDKIQNRIIPLQDQSSHHLSYMMIEFYTLIAMSCLYGGILGAVIVNYHLPNMSSLGKRTSITPTKKGKIIVSNLFASYLIQLIGLGLLFAYTIFVLKVDYGDNLALLVLLALIGSFAGLSLGIAVATLVKSNEKVKTGVLIAITMLGCFLSGMMGVTMKYMVDKHVPIINKINPASMITDGFYSLYYYDTLERYYRDIISLLIFAFVMIGISIRGLRRQKYDHI